jgi:purine-binding chemotaxis protein CheW
MSERIAEFTPVEDTLHGRYLTFHLNEEYYGVEISYVTDIIQMQPIATLPDVSSYIKGIINLRGEIIPVMDVRLLFGKGEAEYTERTCIIVARTDDLCVGLIVDSVSEVLFIADENISPLPKINGASNRYIKGIGKVGREIKLLLDFEEMVADDLGSINAVSLPYSETASD